MRTAAVNAMANATRKAGTGQDSSNKREVQSYSAQQIETAQYVADMVLELRNMAKGSSLFTAMVPLEYAYYEAFAIANRVQVPPEEAERLRQLGEQAQSTPGSGGR